MSNNVNLAESKFRRIFWIDKKRGREETEFINRTNEKKRLVEKERERVIEKEKERVIEKDRDRVIEKDRDRVIEKDRDRVIEKEEIE